MVTDFNVLIIYIITGAVLLATGYHTVLFINNRTKLLRSYSIYLFCILSYCVYCLLRLHKILPLYNTFFDELMQMLICIMYARFLRIATGLDKKTNKWSVLFVASAPVVVLIYQALLYMALYNQNTNLKYVLMGCIRGYFFVIGFYLLIITLKKLRTKYYYYLGTGAVVLIVFAIISTLVEFYFLNGHAVKYRGLTWLLSGFFLEIIFFSGAVGYRTKKENLQRVASLQKIVNQYDIIKQHELDKIKNSYKAKEEERNRIVKDIHDEIGSTVSSISILSNIMLHEKDKTKTDGMLHEVNANAATLMDKIDDIVWSMNPRFDLMESLLLRIKQFATPLFEAKGIDYGFEFDKEMYQLHTPAQTRQYIYYIVKEAVNNLIKYSGCKTTVIKAVMQNEDLIFSVGDNGHGFDAGQQAEGNGLHFMQQRATAINALLNIQSKKDAGTVVTLLIKYPPNI
jgi:signal transduction histidine kinase